MEDQIENIQVPKRIDKRAQTSKANAAKARALRLRQLEEQKKIDASDTDSSDSSDEEIVIRPKKKFKQPQTTHTPAQPQVANGAVTKTEFDELKNIMSGLFKHVQKTAKKQQKKSKQVINIVPSEPKQYQKSEFVDDLRQRILLKF